MDVSPNVRGPLRSRFPGELVLRDLTAGSSLRMSRLISARLVVLQLAERYAAQQVSVLLLSLEAEAAAAYVEPLIGRMQADALALTRVLDRLAHDETRRIITALLGCGDGCLQQAHLMSAYGFTLAAFDLAIGDGRTSAALSATTRLTEIAKLLNRRNAGERWQRQTQKLVARCH